MVFLSSYVGGDGLFEHFFQEIVHDLLMKHFLSDVSHLAEFSAHAVAVDEVYLHMAQE